MSHPSLMLPLTPGAYLKHRRQAAGLAIADVACAVETEPRIAEHLRGEMIALIEADVQPLTLTTIAALRVAFPFDLDVLFACGLAVLVDLRGAGPRVCRYCACSERDPCAVMPRGSVDRADAIACQWVGDDLCSACAPAIDAAATIKVAA